MHITFFYIPFPDRETAGSAGEKMVSHRLAACANIFPISSMYEWNEVMTQEDEVILLLKTRPTLKSIVRDEIQKLHPYDIPCMISWEVEVNDAYGEWVIAQTGE